VWRGSSRRSRSSSDPPAGTGRGTGGSFRVFPSAPRRLDCLFLTGDSFSRRLPTLKRPRLNCPPWTVVSKAGQVQDSCTWLGESPPNRSGVGKARQPADFAGWCPLAVTGEFPKLRASNLPNRQVDSLQLPDSGSCGLHAIAGQLRKFRSWEFDFLANVRDGIHRKPVRCIIRSQSSHTNKEARRGASSKRSCYPERSVPSAPGFGDTSGERRPR